MQSLQLAGSISQSTACPHTFRLVHCLTCIRPLYLTLPACTRAALCRWCLNKNKISMFIGTAVYVGSRLTQCVHGHAPFVKLLWSLVYYRRVWRFLLFKCFFFIFWHYVIKIFSISENTILMTFCITCCVNQNRRAIQHGQMVTQQVQTVMQSEQLCYYTLITNVFTTFLNVLEFFSLAFLYPWYHVFSHNYSSANNRRCDTAAAADSRQWWRCSLMHVCLLTYSQQAPQATADLRTGRPTSVKSDPPTSNTYIHNHSQQLQQQMTFTWAVALAVWVRKPQNYYYIRLMTSFPGQPGSAGTRKVKPVWI